MISAGLLVALIFVYLLVRKVRKRIRFGVGVVLAVLIVVALGTGSLYIYKTVSALDTITQNAQALASVPGAAPQAGAILRAVREIKE